MAQINSEQDLIDGLILIMARDFETHDRTRKIRIAYMAINQFVVFLDDETLKDELKANPKNKAGFYQFWNDFQIVLDWGKISRERIVIEVCKKYEIIIPGDPVSGDPAP